MEKGKYVLSTDNIMLISVHGTGVMKTKSFVKNQTYTCTNVIILISILFH